MKRLLLLSCMFIGATIALVMALAPPVGDEIAQDTVARAQTAPLSLQPALPSSQPQPVPAVVTPVEPVVVPKERSAAPERALRPQMRPVAAVTAPVQAAPKPVLRQPTPSAAPSQTSDDTMTTLREMSFGIVDLLREAPQDAPSENTVAAVAPTPAPEPTSVAPKGQTYVVRAGDSLPGLAFRFYGTTAAYMTIVDANPVLLDDPKALTAGLSIIIPDKP